MGKVRSLLRLAVTRGGGLTNKGAPTQLLTADGQRVDGVEKIEIDPFVGGNPFVRAHLTVLIEIEAMEPPID